MKTSPCRQPALPIFDNRPQIGTSTRRGCGVLLLFLWVVSTGYAQIADDFSDGDFTQNPTWVGDAANFIVNASGELQLNTPGAATSSLALRSNIPAAVRWDLRIRLEFAPSPQNLLRIYLSANKAELATADAYFLQIGETGSADAIRLFRQKGTVKTEITAGLPGVVANAPVALHLRLTRSAAGEFTLEAGPDAQNLQTQFMTTDASYGGNCNAYFGFQCLNTATNKDKFFFDNLSIQALAPDAVPPVLLSAKAEDATHVTATFDETLDSLSAVQTSHYALSGGLGQPLSVSLVAGGNAVLLAFANPMVNGTYQLATNDIADCTGNKSGPQNTTFPFSQPDAAAAFDIVVNEIMADPTPSAGLPELEWVELFNRSAKWIDLKDFTLSDNSGSPKALPSFILAPDSFVVLCATASVGTLKTFTPNALGVTGFPSLNDDGDAVVLRNPSNVLIDQVTYAASWHSDATKRGGGWSLERINPAAFCLGAANWQSAPAAPGASPGKQNGVFATTLTPLGLLSVRTDNATQITVVFNQTLDALAAANPIHYLLNGGAIQVTEAQLGSDQSTVTLRLATPLANGTYRLQVKDLANCSGTIATLPPFDFPFINIEAAAEFDLLINEIMADPSPSVGLPEVEWIELFNRSKKWIDLQSLSISDDSGSPKVLPTYLLGPDSFVVLCTPANALVLGNVSARVLAVSGLPSLNNAGDVLVLSDAVGKIIDRVDFDISWHTEDGKEDGGWSLERINPQTPCLGAANWQSAPSQPGGTPGRQNGAYAVLPDTEAPHLTDAFPIGANLVRLTFSEGMDRNSVENIQAFRFFPARDIASVVLSAEGRTTALLTLDEPLAPATVYTLTMQGQALDCSGNAIPTTDTLRLGLPEKPAPQDIVLNEILFNAPTNGVRYVEFYNRSQKVFSWEDFFIANFTEADVKPVGLRRLLLPGQYAVFTEAPDDVSRRHAHIFPERLISFDLPTLADDRGNLTLYWSKNNETVTVDSFDYDEAYHNALFSDSKRDGVALERINPETATNNAANWTSAAPNVTGAPGTPTLPNSQLLNSATDPGSDLIQLPIGRLSPDFDSFEDFLEIVYQLPNPGFAATIRIYDSEGVPVRRLVRQELIGTEGFLRWDGDMDDGSLARPGIYVLAVELFAPDGEVKRIKKAFALVTRL